MNWTKILIQSAVWTLILTVFHFCAGQEQTLDRLITRFCTLCLFNIVWRWASDIHNYVKILANREVGE